MIIRILKHFVTVFFKKGLHIHSFSKGWSAPLFCCKADWWLKQLPSVLWEFCFSPEAVLELNTLKATRKLLNARVFWECARNCAATTSIHIPHIHREEDTSESMDIVFSRLWTLWNDSIYCHHWINCGPKTFRNPREIWLFYFNLFLYVMCVDYYYGSADPTFK